MSQLVAVTGATGFIGTCLCARLRGAGHRVRALVRRPENANGLRRDGVETLAGSLEDAAALEMLVAGADAVIHCAGSVRGATQADFDRVNVAGLQRLLAALQASDAPPRLLALSSLAAREPQLSFYARSKRRGEELLEASEAVAWTALRPPAVYGPGDRELLPLFRAMARGVAPVPGSPSARFSMLFVDDLAGAALAWLQCESHPQGIYTLDDGRRGGYDWHEVAAIVSRLCGRRVRLLRLPVGLLSLPAWLNRTGARLFGYAPMLTPEKLNELRHPDWVCDSDALIRATGWRPRVRLEEGLARTPGWGCDRRGEG